MGEIFISSFFQWMNR